MEGMEEFFVAKTGRVFGGNPLLETTKISLAQRWEFRLTFGVPRDSDPKRLEKIPFCQKIGVGILWANIPEMSSLKTAKRCCVIYFHICQKKKKTNTNTGSLERRQKGRFQTTQIVNFFTAAVDKAAFQLAEHLAARHLSAGLKPREEQMKRMRGAWRLVHNSYEGGGGQSAGKNALSH